MLTKAHLTSHSRMSGSRWVITPLWYVGHEEEESIARGISERNGVAVWAQQEPWLTSQWSSEFRRVLQSSPRLGQRPGSCTSTGLWATLRRVTLCITWLPAAETACEGASSWRLSAKSIPNSWGNNCFIGQGSGWPTLVSSTEDSLDEDQLVTFVYLFGTPMWLRRWRSACRCRRCNSIPGPERSPGEGNGFPLQYSCLENSMDRGAWQSTVHGVAQ